MKFIIYKDKKGEWRWSLVARNGRKIADSAEGYKTHSHTVKIVYRLIGLSHLAKVVEQ